MLLHNVLCLQAPAAGGVDVSKSLDLKLLAMQELMAKERKAGEAEYAHRRAAGSFVPPDLTAESEARLPELLLQHYSSARPITEPFTITVSGPACHVSHSHSCVPCAACAGHAAEVS